MKHILNISLFLLVLSTYAISAEALESPAKRTCRQAGGLFWALSMDRVEDGAVLCRFGEAAISADSFAARRNEGVSSIAIEAYLSAVKGTTCQLAEGKIVEEMDSEGTFFSLCRFSDGSYVELITLERGSGAYENQALTRAL